MIIPQYFLGYKGSEQGTNRMARAAACNLPPGSWISYPKHCVLPSPCLVSILLSQSKWLLWRVHLVHHPCLYPTPDNAAAWTLIRHSYTNLFRSRSSTYLCRPRLTRKSTTSMETVSPRDLSEPNTTSNSMRILQFRLTRHAARVFKPGEILHMCVENKDSSTRNFVVTQLG